LKIIKEGYKTKEEKGIKEMSSGTKPDIYFFVHAPLVNGDNIVRNKMIS
jgi:hypothetical protein